MTNILSKLSEREILHLAAKGRGDAFKVLFDRYHQHLAKYILALSGSPQLAEDVVQEIFLKIWLDRGGVGSIINFKAYLFVMAKNYVFNQLRKKVRERSREEIWFTESFNQESTDGEEYVVNEHYDKIIDQAITQLPPQQQKVFILSRFRRLKYSEIAFELNISKESVKKYLKKASDAVKFFVKEHPWHILLFFLNIF